MFSTPTPPGGAKLPTEPMTLSDRILFHQIHAAKLVTDVLAAVLSFLIAKFEQGIAKAPKR